MINLLNSILNPRQLGQNPSPQTRSRVANHNPEANRQLQASMLADPKSLPITVNGDLARPSL